MKSKMYTNQPRKPMMYGGMTMKPKTMGDKMGMMYGGKTKMAYGGKAPKK